MAKTALDAGRPVVFIHYARNAHVHAFGDVLREWSVDHPQFQSYVVYEQAPATDQPAPHAVGRPSREHLAQWLPADQEYEAYFLGPKPFMAFIKRTLRDLGLPDERSRYEFFGPAEALS